MSNHQFKREEAAHHNALYEARKKDELRRVQQQILNQLRNVQDKIPAGSIITTRSTTDA